MSISVNKQYHICELHHQVDHIHYINLSKNDSDFTVGIKTFYCISIIHLGKTHQTIIGNFIEIKWFAC